ncbi:hypothetical protein E2C01_028333 [Portunus trituberculatus]|uniref:Uncharacterized protein n=1 Tax=Portunus trituberculatus TaxID=210409 RepID=A0A5B7EP13_PORTR|nr:hypothetical protein [Portunus trituberculatus]
MWRWRGARLLLAGLLLTGTHAAPKETDGVVADGGTAEGVDGGSPHHRVRRQGLDGFSFTKDGLLALERLDIFLRDTIPNVDRFNCMERLMCYLSSSQFISSEPEFPGGQIPGFDPTFQQGLILDPTNIQQSLSGLAQNPGVLQQGLQGLLGGQGLQGLVQNPALQQGLGQVIPTFQNPALHNPTFQNPAIPSPGFHTQNDGFQVAFPVFRENPDTTGRVSSPDTSGAASVPQVVQQRPVRRRPFRRRPQRRGFLDFLSGLGKRKKRSIFDDLLSGVNARTFMNVLDQMMSRYSFYPYTHAAFMGMTGSPDSCARLYSSCPTTPDQMLDFFNNIHKHYPDGIPYKENLPWPFNQLLP